MPSPSKVKENSLSQFYRKLEYHESSMNLNESDPNMFGKIHSSPQSKIYSEYSELDLQSNMKKDQKMFIQKLKSNSPYNLNHQGSPKKSTPNKNKLRQQNVFAKQREQSQINKNDETSFDYNLSVQPEQIQIPQVQKKYSNSQSQRQKQEQKQMRKVSPIRIVNVLTPQKVKVTKQRENNKFQSQYSEVVQRLNWGQNLKSKAQNSEISNIRKIKQTQQQIASPILSSDDQEGSEILLKCNQLQSKVKSLKEQKYQFAIQKYRIQCQKHLQKQFQLQKNKINSTFSNKVLNIQNAFQSQKNRFQKAKQDIKRYKEAYELILNELSMKKGKILQQFQQSLQKVKSYEEKSIIEWKRQSNEQIKKTLSEKILMF